MTRKRILNILASLMVLSMILANTQSIVLAQDEPVSAQSPTNLSADFFDGAEAAQVSIEQDRSVPPVFTKSTACGSTIEIRTLQMPGNEWREQPWQVRVVSNGQVDLSYGLSNLQDVSIEGSKRFGIIDRNKMAMLGVGIDYPSTHPKCPNGSETEYFDLARCYYTVSSRNLGNYTQSDFSSYPKDINHEYALTNLYPWMGYLAIHQQTDSSLSSVFAWSHSGEAAFIFEQKGSQCQSLDVVYTDRIGIEISFFEIFLAIMVR